jgi:glycolate oxidase iron-sulfur subunit
MSDSATLDLVGLARDARDAKPSAFHGVDVPSYADIINCMHCGLCLPQCPTYQITQLERHSPRGRIRLIKTIADGGLDVTPAFAESMHFCLLCRACETACPAGVKYGELAEAARAQIELSGAVKTAKRTFLRWLFFRQIFPHPWALRLLGKLTWMHLHLVRPVVRGTGLIRLLPKRLQRLEAMTPSVSWRPGRRLMREVNPPEGAPRFRVGLLEGCLMDITFADEQYDTMAALRHNGCEVVMPRGQVCCGSLLGHCGDMEQARALAKRNIEVFERAGIDYLVLNSAGCGSFMREYGHLLHDDPAWAPRAAALGAKVRDIAEFLMEIGPKPPTVPIRRRATYHEACHLVHGQKVSAAPRELLAMIPGIEWVELPEATWCCGSAGIYNITNTEDSMKFLARKMDNIEKVRPEIIATGNPGCIIQIRLGCAERGLRAEVVHPVTLLREAYGLEGPPAGFTGRGRRRNRFAVEETALAR